MLTYSQKLFNDAVDKVRTMYYNGSTADEIAVSTNMSLIIVEEIIKTVLQSKHKT